MALTAMATYAPGDTITSAWANIIKTNFTVLDARTAGDPGAAGKLAVSDGAASAIWTDDGTAVVNALGYTPLDRAGSNTMTGKLDVTTNVSGQEAIKAHNQHATGWGLLVYDAAGVAADFIVTHAAATFGVTISAATATLSGLLTGAAATFSGLLTAASASITGTLVVSGTTTANAKTTVAAAGSAISDTMYGTALLEVRATTDAAPAIGFHRNGLSAFTLYELANRPRIRTADSVDAPLAFYDGSGRVADSVLLGGVAANGYARVAIGTYVGDGTTRSVTGLPFTPSLVLITMSEVAIGTNATVTVNGTMSAHVNGATSTNISTPADAISGTTFQTSVASATNLSTYDYTWIAFD